MGLLIFAGVVVVLLLAPWFVADSRDGADWKPMPRPSRRSTGPVRPFLESAAALRVRAAGRHLAYRLRLARS